MRDIYSYINELEHEIEEYRTIGTVEECRAAVEKQRAKKPERSYRTYHTIEGKVEFKEVEYYCPDCGGKLLCDIYKIYINGGKSRYCPHCGQTISWENNTL